MQKRRAQPIRSEYVFPLGQRKLRKNALRLNQSAFSNFALYVIKLLILMLVLTLASLMRTGLNFEAVEPKTLKLSK